MARKVAFCFTLNNYTAEDELALSVLDCKYLVYGHEVAPTTGTPHLQGYIVFKDAHTLSSLRSIGLGISWTVNTRGDADVNYLYCTKEGVDIVERGRRPVSQAKKGKMEKDRWSAAILAVSEKRYDDVDGDILGKHLRSVEYAASKLHKRKLEDLDALENEWHYGDPHSGKSATRALHPGCYVKLAHSKWWDDYQDEDVVFIDDFSDRKLVDEMICFADKYPVRVEVKGGSMIIRPKRVIVTSQFRPGSYTDDAVRAAALERRFVLVRHVFDPNHIDERGARSCAMFVDEREGRDPPEADAPGRAI